MKLVACFVASALFGSLSFATEQVDSCAKNITVCHFLQMKSGVSETKNVDIPVEKLCRFTYNSEGNMEDGAQIREVIDDVEFHLYIGRQARFEGTELEFPIMARISTLDEENRASAGASTSLDGKYLSVDLAVASGNKGTFYSVECTQK